MSLKDSKALEKPKKIIPAFTVIRADGGWSFVQLYVDQDFKIVSHEIAQADVKAVSTERFKIAVGKYWGKLDEQG